MIEKLLKLLKIKFAGEIPLKDGTMIIVEGDLMVGASVYVQSPDGKIPLPDGDYELETGQILSAKDGKIEAITDVVDTEEIPDMPGNPPVGEIVAPVVAEAVVPEPEVKVEVEPEKEPKADEVAALKDMVDELTKRLEALEAKVSMRDELETKMKEDLEFIKNKTLTQELKKSKDIDEVKTTSRMDIIKNLKNKQ